jgi:NAD(P)-dependent dehydrogenase (short-subunit alcohol dehydrogenase family)
VQYCQQTKTIKYNLSMNKRVAIVTGASRGIGKAIAILLFEKGYYVTIVSDDEHELNEAAKEMPEDHILILPGDLANLNFAQKVIDETYEKWGMIEVLVNNAAWREIETLRTMTVDHWNKTLQVCLTAPAFLSKWASHYMEENGNAGVIINVSSVMADRPAGTAAAYVACKGALLSLTYEMAALLGPARIRVVAVSPGNIDTGSSQDYVDEKGENISDQLIEHFEGHTPLQRSGQANEIAKAVVWLCSDEASYITGTNLVIDGGFSTNFNGYKMKKLQFPNQF